MVAQEGAVSQSGVQSMSVEDPTATLDSWLSHICKLQREDKTVEARASFKAFIKRYPDYPVTDGFEGLK